MANINRWAGQRGLSIANQMASMPVRRVDVHRPIVFLQSVYGQPWVRDFILSQNGNPVALAEEIRTQARERAAVMEPDDYPPDSAYWQHAAERCLQHLREAMGKERYQEWLDEMVNGLDTWRTLATNASDALADELERAACLSTL